MQGRLGDADFAGDVGVTEPVEPPGLHKPLGHVEDFDHRVAVAALLMLEVP